MLAPPVPEPPPQEPPQEPAREETKQAEPAPTEPPKQKKPLFQFLKKKPEQSVATTQKSAQEAPQKKSIFSFLQRKPAAPTQAAVPVPPPSGAHAITTQAPNQRLLRADRSMFSLRIYRRLGGSFSPGFTAYISKKLKVAGIKDETRIWLGEAFLTALMGGLVPLAAYLIVYDPYVIFSRPLESIHMILLSLLLFIVGFLFISAIYYFNLYFRIADRTSALEKILPDFLSLTVSNLRAGMNPYYAFVQGARPEFGAFYDEVHLAMAKMGSKASIAEALIEVADNFDSPVLHRTVTLFAKGLRSGGHLVRLLNSSADEVRRIQDLRAELASSTMTYTIFLGFIVVIIMPFLLSVSTIFVTIFVKIQTESMGGGMEESASSSLPSFGGKILVTANDMLVAAVITLAITTFLVSMLMGVVLKGKALYGLKNFPWLLIASVVFYLAAKTMVSSFLSAFAG